MKSVNWIAIGSALSWAALTACSAAEDQTWIEGEGAPVEIDGVHGPIFETALEEAAPEEAAPEEAAPEEAEAADAPLGTARQALGNNCKNVRISVENLFELESNPVPILVRYVKYFNADKGNNGEWVKELLPNEQVNYGAEDSWVQNLEGAEGDRITKWRVYFSYSTGNEWSGTYYVENNTTDRICNDGIAFDLTVQ